jgi:hypothetical protein
VQRFAPLALTLFGAAGMIAGVSVAADDPSCRKDYPVPTKPVDYRQEFAGGSLLPSEISLNAHVIKLGMTPVALKAVLGEPTRESPSERRSSQEQCEYLVRLLQEHPTSMHLYKLAPLRLKSLAGAFRISEWELPSIGTIKSFWYTPEQAGRESSYLYYFLPIAIASTEVERLKGEDNTLLRAGPPRIEWNIETNRLSIENQGAIGGVHH